MDNIIIKTTVWENLFETKMKLLWFSFLSLLLIQEGQLSVSGERMCTILVNHLEDYACPVNVWLGKLTKLDMTPLGWLGCKTSTQTNISKLTPLATFNICNSKVLGKPMYDGS